jgi:hypothetical protein
MDSVPPDPLIEMLPHTVAPMRRYLAIWALTIAVLIGAVLGVCALADPYAVLGTPRIAGLNARKPAAADWPRITKAYMVQRAHPATLIVGNSTADVGFNPDSDAWPAAARPVFNLAVDGGLPSTHLRYLQHALSVIQPAQLVMTINFSESMVMPTHQLSAATQSQYDFEPRMLVTADGAPNPAYEKGHIADIVFSTLSLTALKDSISTLFGQHDQGATFETAAGWNDGGKFHRWAHDDGFYSLVMNKDRANAASFPNWRQTRKLQTAEIQEMVQIARQRHMKVVVIILPNHADQMELLRQLNYNADYDAWKKTIVSELARYDNPADVALWDFSGFSTYTTEAMPAEGDHTHQWQWFWEPVHFQSALGDLMIKRTQGAVDPANFGIRLTRDNVQSQIDAYHAAQAAWEAKHPNDVARIAALFTGH